MRIRSTMRASAILAVLVLVPALLNAQGSEYHFPHVADGTYSNGYYSTSFSISNPFNDAVQVSLWFYQSNGAAWSVNLQSNDRPDLAGRRSNLSFTLKSNESVLIFTAGTDPLKVGWAMFIAEWPIVVSEAFGDYGRLPVAFLGSEAGVLASAPALRFTFFAAVARNEPISGTHIDTGFAIANPSGATARVTATLTSRAGVQLSQKTLTLPPNGQTATFVSQLFNDVSFAASFHGRVNLSSNVNIPVVALRQSSGNSNTISTIAVTPDSTTGYITIYDQEPNDGRETVQPLGSLPAEIIGTMTTPDDGDDLDLYSVVLYKGEVLYIFATAEFLNSPLNCSIRLWNSSGTKVADVDTFSEGLRDPFIRYTVPATGTYFIDIGSVGKTSSRDAFYRMHVLVK